jgi:hypothetical protein
VLQHWQFNKTKRGPAHMQACTRPVSGHHQHPASGVAVQAGPQVMPSTPTPLPWRGDQHLFTPSHSR